jgi:ribosome biogenesis GTPase
LGLAEASAGIGELFADIQALTEACKFRDCAHESEPGCAVTAAVAAGALDKERLERWRKLKREEQVYTAGAAETRSRQKGQQRIYNEGAKRGRAKRGDSGRR